MTSTSRRTFISGLAVAAGTLATARAQAAGADGHAAGYDVAPSSDHMSLIPRRSGDPDRLARHHLDHQPLHRQALRPCESHRREERRRQGPHSARTCSKRDRAVNCGDEFADRRLQGAVERQRRFVSDAAHELRTPLAALQIQVDNLQVHVKSKSTAWRETIDDLKAGVRRAGALVEQLLKMARLNGL